LYFGITEGTALPCIEYGPDPEAGGEVVNAVSSGVTQMTLTLRISDGKSGTKDELVYIDVGDYQNGTLYIKIGYGQWLAYSYAGKSMGGGD
jgi:hypothetical protein